MLDTLSRLIIGGAAGASRQATAALADCYLTCAKRAAQLARHAEMAPQRYSAEALKELAAGEQTQAERLRQALQAAGATVASVPPEPLPPGALNHWARLVQDLQMHRISAQRFRELAIHFAETLPTTAGLFDTLCREEVAHCEDLRALIARADPQALD